MSTDSCERCGDQAPAALLRNVKLQVDGDDVDEQTLCPDCFADWIARYQGEMAGNMAGVEDDTSEESVGGDITVAEEEPTASAEIESSALSQAVDAAREQAESGVQSEARAQTSDLASHPTGGDEIQEVERDPSVGSDDDGDEIEIDLSGGSDDEDDDGGLL